MAKAEVFSFVEFDDVEGLVEDFGSEGPGGHLREVFGEGNDDDCVEAGGGKELEFFGEWGDEREDGFGTEGAGGVGLEGDRHGFCAESAGAVYDFFDDPQVAAMDSVEVADGGDGGAEVGGDLGE